MKGFSLKKKKVILEIKQLLKKINQKIDYCKLKIVYFIILLVIAD